MTEGNPVRVSVSEGYTIWAKTYDSTWNTLIATAELYSLGFLDSLTGTTALDVGAGTGSYALKLARNGWDVTAVDANLQCWESQGVWPVTKGCQCGSARHQSKMASRQVPALSTW